MTLLDAPQFDLKRANLRRNIGIGVLVFLLLAGVGAFWFRNWPAEHRVSGFLATVESGDFSKAYGLWYHDPAWQQHPQQYSAYDFNQFQKDWGPMSDYGKIRSHKIIMSKSVGNGTVIGVDINGGKTPMFLRVDDQNKQIGFSPVELYVGP